MTFERPSLSRTVRNVTVSLSALQFQAALHSSVVDQSDPLVSVCTKGHPAARIRQTTACSSCGSTETSNWGKARELGDALVVLPEKELAAIREADDAFKKVLDLTVVEADSTYLMSTGDSYFLAPKGPATTNYNLIAAVVRRRPKLAFVGEFSFRGAPKLFRLEVGEGGVLVLREIARPEAIRERPQVAGDKPAAPMLTLAEQLVDAMAQPFDPERFVNRHARQVGELIAATPAVVAAPAAAPVSPAGGDLMAQLQASLDLAQAAKAPAAKGAAAKGAATRPRRTTKKTASAA